MLTTIDSRIGSTAKRQGGKEIAKAARNQQLTFNRMREVNMWAKAFGVLQWVIVPALALSLLGACDYLMWRLGEEGSRAHPVRDAAADRDVLYASWRFAPAVFYAAVSMCIAVAIVRFGIKRFAKGPSGYRPWLGAPSAAFDFVKLSLSVALSISLCFYATFRMEHEFPNFPSVLKPPSTVQLPGFFPNFLEWLGTRGVQFVVVSLLSLLLATFVIRVNDRSILPRGKHLVPAAILCTLLFEAFYSLSERFLGFLFFGTYEQGRWMLVFGLEIFAGMLLFALLFTLGMIFVTRNLVRPDRMAEVGNAWADCNVVLAGDRQVGKSRFFGEALRTILRTPPRSFSVEFIGETSAFYDIYKGIRKRWLLQGTTIPEKVQFSIRKTDEVIRFKWQDIPGGVIDRTVSDRVMQMWKAELYNANALCIFLDCGKVVASGSLAEYPSFENIRAAPFTFISELKKRRDFERPPVICIVGTKTDRIKPHQERQVRRALEEFAGECRDLIKRAGLPRSYVGVRLTSAMINMRAKDPPRDVAEDTEMEIEPVSSGCGEVLMWVAAKVIEAKSLGLDGPSAAFRGRATTFGELQIDLEEFAG